MVFKKNFFEKTLTERKTPSPPFIENSIKNFQFVFWNTSLRIEKKVQVSGFLLMVVDMKQYLVWRIFSPETKRKGRGEWRSAGVKGKLCWMCFFQKSEIALFWEYPMSFVNKSLGQAIEESAPTLGCVCSIIFPFAFSAKVIPADLTYQTQSENEINCFFFNFQWYTWKPQTFFWNMRTPT